MFLPSRGVGPPGPPLEARGWRWAAQLEVGPSGSPCSFSFLTAENTKGNFHFELWAPGSGKQSLRCNQNPTMFIIFRRTVSL